MNKNLLILILLFLAGIISSNIFGWGGDAKVVTIVIVFLIALLIISKGASKIFYILLCVLFFTLGAFRYSSDLARKENDISYFTLRDSPSLLPSTTDSKIALSSP